MTSKKCESVSETPLRRSLNLSEQLGCQVYIKDETALPGRSHKYRGAYNQIAHLDPNTSWKGVITSSTGTSEFCPKTHSQRMLWVVKLIYHGRAGTHGECVAFASCQLKVPAIIVMPIDTPSPQQSRMKTLKATVVLAGHDLSGAQEEAERLTKMHDLYLITKRDEILNLAGLGNIGAELGRQTDLMDVYAVFVPMTSGELVAGVGFYIRRFAPKVKIVAVTLGDGCATPSVASRKQFLDSLVKSEEQLTDGLSPRLFFEMVDEVVQVTLDELSDAIQDCFEETHSFAKPSGAFGVAGLKSFVKQRPEEVSCKRLIAVMSNGATSYDDVGSTISQISGMTQTLQRDKW